MELGLRVGLYTSPHLLRFNERIKVNGEEIRTEDLEAAFAWFSGLQKEYSSLFPNDYFGAFEAFTAVALFHFNHSDVEVIVSEGGIGGRYDWTGVLPMIGADTHRTGTLRDTRQTPTGKNAFDKADICPDGGDLIVGRIDAEVRRRLSSYCRLRRVRAIYAEELCKIYGPTSQSPDRMEFGLKCDGIDFGRLRSSLIGEHQIGNIAVAVLAVSHWIAQRRQDIAEAGFRSAVQRALPRVKWPGRLQRIRQNPDVIIDVGHTPQSMRTTVAAINSLRGPKKVLLVTGVSRDKDVRGILAEIVPVADRILCTSAYHKGETAAVIRDHCRALRPELDIHSAEHTDQAAIDALRMVSSDSWMVLIAGGLFVSIETMWAMQGRDPRELQFA